MDNNQKQNLLKLLALRKNNENYQLKIPILEGKFNLDISISAKNEIEENVTDEEGNIYYLYKVKSAQGAFVNKVKAEINEYLSLIKAYINKESLILNQRNQVEEYILENYNIKPEYLWESDPTSAVFRNSENHKWFALLATIDGSKLGDLKKRKIDIINIKLKPDEIIEITDNCLFFPAWHMNKKHWITILLDNGLSNEKLIDYINKSYNLVNSR